MRRIARWFLGTPEGRVWLVLLLGPVLVLNIAGHSATSVHIVVVVQLLRLRTATGQPATRQGAF
jgi:hypothetical protein